MQRFDHKFPSDLLRELWVAAAALMKLLTCLQPKD